MVVALVKNPNCCVSASQERISPTRSPSLVSPARQVTLRGTRSTSSRIRVDRALLLAARADADGAPSHMLEPWRSRPAALSLRRRVRVHRSPVAGLMGRARTRRLSVLDVLELTHAFVPVDDRVGHGQASLRCRQVSSGKLCRLVTHHPWWATGVKERADSVAYTDGVRDAGRVRVDLLATVRAATGREVNAHV